MMTNKKAECLWTAERELVPYDVAIAVMHAHVDLMLAQGAPEKIWLLEHPPLYTAGTSARAQDLLARATLPVVPTERGGKHTYHGPGQRIAYVMMDLAKRDRDLRAHVWRIEEWGLRALAALGVKAERRAGRVGLWAPVGNEDQKIAAIGVRCRRWVTSHGMAINVCPDLSAFNGIVPCGLADASVTSLAALGVAAGMDDVDRALRDCFDGVFG